jgi:hypothetical protein
MGLCFDALSKKIKEARKLKLGICTSGSLSVRTSGIHFLLHPFCLHISISDISVRNASFRR